MSLPHWVRAISDVLPGLIGVWFAPSGSKLSPNVQLLKEYSLTFDEFPDPRLMKPIVSGTYQKME